MNYRKANDYRVLSRMRICPVQRIPIGIIALPRSLRSLTHHTYTHMRVNRITQLAFVDHDDFSTLFLFSLFSMTVEHLKSQLPQLNPRFPTPFKVYALHLSIASFSKTTIKVFLIVAKIKIIDGSLRFIVVIIALSSS